MDRTRELLIRKYFGEGYPYSLIVGFLSMIHGILDFFAPVEAYSSTNGIEEKREPEPENHC